MVPARPSYMKVSIFNQVVIIWSDNTWPICIQSALSVPHTIYIQTGRLAINLLQHISSFQTWP